MLIAVICIIFTIVLDQAVKYWAATRLSQVATIPVIENVFHLTYVQNTGAAFSMFQNGRWFFVFFTILVLCVLIYALYRGYVRHAVGRWGLYFIIGGAIGNLIDRIRMGYVVDLFDFTRIHFAVFNVADAFVSVGAALLIFYILFLYKDEQKSGDTNV